MLLRRHLPKLKPAPWLLLRSLSPLDLLVIRFAVSPYVIGCPAAAVVEPDWCAASFAQHPATQPITIADHSLLLILG